MSETLENPEVEKPKFLYHASTNRNIEEFEPRRGSYRDPTEGPVIFASPSKAYASMFITKADDRWAIKGRFSDTFYTVISDEERFRNIDKGGSIYTLPPDTFTCDPKKSMGVHEWVSKVPVKPLKVEDYDSCLEAMLENGVQVFFVNKETFKEINNSSDHGNKILKALESENKKRNMNIKEIPDFRKK